MQFVQRAKLREVQALEFALRQSEDNACMRPEFQALTVALATGDNAFGSAAFDSLLAVSEASQASV